MIAALFYFVILCLAYTYILYPLLIWFMGAVSRRPVRGRRDNQFDWPVVSVLVAAHNEEHSIRDRITNFLKCGYPGSAEMLIVSDGSTDRTLEFARESECERVIIMESAARRGKGAAINLAAAAAHGDILVFTDANSMFREDALTQLARHFADPNVGLVTGSTQYPAATIGSAYQRYEQMLKRLESRSGVVATADGAIYAMRRSLWHAYDPGLINDFLHPIIVSLAGRTSLIEPDAICIEHFSIDNEFARQVRMVSQAAYVYVKFLLPLIYARRWRSVLVLTSHKLLRWLTAPLLAGAVVTTVLLAPGGGIYEVALWAETVFFAAGLFGAVTSVLGLDQRVGAAWHFISLNCACAIGLWRGLVGDIPVIWRPRNL